ncbi:MAG: DUF2829 domain-containing protein [Pseudomonadota bacterium]|nr:DUF2829 domain-containing protein [Pseudomonadota bacterium]
MRKFIGVKFIAAMAMTVGNAMRDHDVRLSPDPSGKDRADNEAGYLVEYDSGYKSWSPKEVFDAAYRPADAMTFGLALEALKRGERVARADWHSMWLSLSCGETREIPAENFWSPHNRAHAESQGGKAKVLPSITMKTATGEILMGWLASQPDMLAEDWIIVE